MPALRLWQQAAGITPDSKLYGANMGPNWGWQDPGGPHFGPMNFPIWDMQLNIHLAMPYIVQW